MKKYLLMFAIVIGVMLVVNHGYGNQTISGKDMVCQQINYLSSNCMNSNAVPFEYYDREIAKIKAQQPITETVNITKNNIKVVEKKEAPKQEDDGVIITSYWTYDE